MMKSGILRAAYANFFSPSYFFYNYIFFSVLSWSSFSYNSLESPLEGIFLRYAGLSSSTVVFPEKYFLKSSSTNLLNTYSMFSLFFKVYTSMTLYFSDTQISSRIGLKILSSNQLESSPSSKAFFF